MSAQWGGGPSGDGRRRQGIGTAPPPRVPDPRSGGGRAEARRSRKPKRNVKKIAAWTAAGALVLTVAAGGAVYLLINGSINAFDPGGVATDRPPEAPADADGNRPVNVLLIGSDSRGGDNSDLGGGADGGARSDTTILLHVYADHKHAIGLSIPRDTLVTIAKCRLPSGKWTKEQPATKFNEAFSVGGTDKGNPACTQNTVELLTGIRVDHTIQVDFQGFSAITKAVKGVDVCLPEAVYEGDINPKLGRKGKQVLPAGKQRVDGQQALDYVRLRHGIGDGSDIGRMKRQQAFMSSLVSEVKKNGLNPDNLLPLANAATGSMTVDPGLDSAAKLLSFALSMKNIDMHDLKFLTPSWHYQPRGKDQDLVFTHPDVDNLWATVKADRTIDGQDATGQQPDAPAESPSVSPSPSPSAAPTADGNSTVKVAVYNGTTVAGTAARASAALEAAGFTVTRTASAPSTNHATTLVEYGTGQKANADKVAALFPGATTAPGRSAGVTLTLGRDYAATAAGATTPAATTAAAPPPLPASVADGARSADDDICANTSYGTGG